MEEEILTIINDYTMDKKVLDKEAIKKIVDIIINKNHLNQYVKELVFDEKTTSNTRNFYTLVKYNFENRIILIYLETIEEYLSEKNKKYLKDKYEEILYLNFEYLKIILHEIRHADQMKFQKETDRSVIKELLDFCDMTALISEKKYDQAWEYDPKERDAENFANANIVKLLYEYDRLATTPLFLLNKELDKSIFNGYSSNIQIYPFIKYLNINYKDSSVLCDWFSEEEFSKVALKYRFNYGLKLSSHEYEQMLSMKK